MNFTKTYSLFVLSLCCFSAGSVVAASTITVETTAMEVSDTNPFGIENGLCSIDEAFVGFNGPDASDCMPQVSGDISPLVIELQPVVYSLISELRMNDSQGDVIELQGNGATIERSDAAVGDFRLMRATTALPDFKFIISDLTFRNAETTETGAALYVLGFDLELSDVTFKNNYSMGMDVGIGQAGGLLVNSFSPNQSNVKIQHCRFEGNSADRFAGAAFFGEVSGTISDTTFVNNIAVSAGALYSSHSNLLVVNSEFIGNHASSRGGAIRAESQADSPSTNGMNGLNITSSTFRDNISDINGGAIDSTANPTVISSSLFQGNEAYRGGAILRGLPYATDFSIYNSTFTENKATTNGGAIAIQHGKVSLQSVTMVGNDATRFGGGIWMDDTATASVSVDHSIIKSNSAGLGPNDCYGTNRSGGDYSIISYCDLPLAAHEVSRAIVLLTDILEPLADNGGGTKTFAPVEGGIAHNLGNRAYPADVGFDQRGFPRIAEGRVDIGAHERSAEQVTGMFDVIFNHSMESDEPLRFFDREEFLAVTGAYDATGALPNLGNQKTNPNPIDVGTLTFVRYSSGSFYFGQWSPNIPGLPDAGDTVDLALNDLEEFDVQSFAIRAFGFDFVDPNGDGAPFQMLACSSTFDPVTENCPQNNIMFAMDFSSNNTERRFFGFMLNRPFRQVSIRELSNSGSNEYWGHFYTTPEP